MPTIQTRIMTVLLSLLEWFIHFLMPKYSRMLWRSQCSSDNMSLQLAYLLGVRHQEDVNKILVVSQKICYHRWRREERWSGFAWRFALPSRTLVALHGQHS